MESSVSARESVVFYRREDVPGVESRRVENSHGTWHSYSTGFEFVTSQGWRGQLWHRRREEEFGPGMLLSAQPGDVFLARRVLSPGARHSISLEPDVLRGYTAEHAVSSELWLPGVARTSLRLSHTLHELAEVLRPGPSRLEVQTRLVEFVAMMVHELCGRTDPLTPTPRITRAAERVRECLHFDTSVSVDLSTLAEHVGLSRFQTLRAFKRCYGLPPHAYQLRLRVGLAQKSLREGQNPARVAAEYGFVDQSHMTRHFKRLLGVTPGQYARVGATAR